MSRIFVAATLAALAAAAPAGAATTLGTTASGGNGCSSDSVVWGIAAAYTVPAGGGVITSMATTVATAGGHESFKVVRVSGATATVVGTTASFPVTAGVNRLAMHVPVSGGESIGTYTPDGAYCATGVAGGDQGKSSIGGDPPEGATISPLTIGMGQVAVQATLEPDADHDGFGDDSEDGCPTDPVIHTGPCQVDLGVTQSVTPATIGVGDVGVATVTLKNGSTGIAAGVALGATVTPGLQIVSAVPGTGCVFAPALSCPLGSLAGGGSVLSALVLKGTAVGAQSVSSAVTTSTTDPNAANDTASSPITVETRVALVCTVPKLMGLTKAVAKQLLAAVNCKLGKTSAKKAKKGKKGTVIKQATKPKTVVAAGTKVNVTLKK